MDKAVVSTQEPPSRIKHSVALNGIHDEYTTIQTQIAMILKVAELRKLLQPGLMDKKVSEVL